MQVLLFILLFLVSCKNWFLWSWYEAGTGTNLSKVGTGTVINSYGPAT
jgi:hypothetical protein